MMFSIGMHGHKLTRKKPIINYASQDKLKLMIRLQNQLKYKDKLVHKWKNKDYLLIKERISLFNQICILIVKCGNKEEIKLRFIYKG
jgi:hypothetical protein